MGPAAGWRRFSLDDLPALLGELLELAQRGQRVEILQGEELEELAGGAVEDRPAHLFLLPDDLDQPAIEQRLEHRARVDAANVLDLRPRDRLPVGDDRQRLDRRAGEPLGLHLEEAPHVLGRARRGAQLPAAADLVQHEPDHEPSRQLALQRLERRARAARGRCRWSRRAGRGSAAAAQRRAGSRRTVRTCSSVSLLRAARRSSRTASRPRARRCPRRRPRRARGRPAGSVTAATSSSVKVAGPALASLGLVIGTHDRTPRRGRPRPPCRTRPAPLRAD